MENEIIKFNAKNGEVELNADFEHDTIWATQEQIAQLFEVQRPAVTRHIGNIYKSGELDEKVVCSILEHTTQHGAMVGKTQSRNVKVYNLDMILSIGYRVNSKKATEFRKWANGVLKQYISKGYAINEKRLTDLNLVFQILERSEIPELSGTINLVSEYTQALFLLDSYDRKELPDVEGTSETWRLDYKNAREFLESLPDYAKSEMFAKERTGQFKGILEQIYAGFGDTEYYPSVEAKAANLLYFIVKDHPFYDGNKRSAAALFVYFLYKNQALRNINNNTLAAIVLMVALSKPDERENMTLLIENFLGR
ncbi:MAG: virulence protein RhuM/Fic/DOC family protein [Streptococcaceae bacterium]|jgi:prophage maintenance system killer protein|nr:virulence protein RhuM/Fic/DOC family protein [Streptococcaceae bacterium]